MQNTYRQSRKSACDFANRFLNLSRVGLLNIETLPNTEEEYSISKENSSTEYYTNYFLKTSLYDNANNINVEEYYGV